MDIKSTKDRFLAMSEEDDASGSGSELGSSPSSRIIGHGSDLFKTLLDDYIISKDTRISKTEFERYKLRQQNKNRNCEEHGRSKRCDSCQLVMAFCKCAMYHGSTERKFGHRVHWADEVWDKPLSTYFTDADASESDNDYDQVDGHFNGNDDDKLVEAFRHSMPKPILKHKATCIVIISE